MVLMRSLPLSMIEALLNSVVTRLCTFAKASELSVKFLAPSADLLLSYIGETGRSFVAGNREHKEY